MEHNKWKEHTLHPKQPCLHLKIEVECHLLVISLYCRLRGKKSSHPWVAAVFKSIISVQNPWEKSSQQIISMHPTRPMHQLHNTAPLPAFQTLEIIPASEWETPSDARSYFRIRILGRNLQYRRCGSDISVLLSRHPGGGSRRTARSPDLQGPDFVTSWTGQQGCYPSADTQSLLSKWLSKCRHMVNCSSCY